MRLFIQSVSFVASLACVGTGAYWILHSSPLAIVAFALAYLASQVVYHLSPFASGTEASAPHAVGLGSLCKYIFAAVLIGTVVTIAQLFF